MILDALEQSVRYASLHPRFAAAFEFLRTAQLAELSLGRHDIDGDRLFALISREPGRGRAGSKLEAHRRYIDIQYVIGGDDLIGWQPTATCHTLTMPYSDERDVALWSDEPACWLTVAPGQFVIFFPSDAHAPLATTGEARKAVLKVAV